MRTARHFVATADSRPLGNAGALDVAAFAPPPEQLSLVL
jgi:hypothetical protein